MGQHCKHFHNKVPKFQGEFTFNMFISSWIGFPQTFGWLKCWLTAVFTLHFLWGCICKYSWLMSFALALAITLARNAHTFLSLREQVGVHLDPSLLQAVLTCVLASQRLPPCTALKSSIDMQDPRTEAVMRLGEVETGCHMTYRPVSLNSWHLAIAQKL